MMVFLVSGLWHGASWHFVVWGGINGIYNVLQDVTESFRQQIYRILKIDTDVFLWKCFCGLATFFFIDVSWLFFRASGMRQAIAILKKIWHDLNLWYYFSEDFFNIFGSTRDLAIMFLSFTVIFLIDIFRRIGFDLKGYLLRQQIVYRWVAYFTIIFIIMLWGAYGSDYEQTQFIYFQF